MSVSRLCKLRHTHRATGPLQQLAESSLQKPPAAQSAQSLPSAADLISVGKAWSKKPPVLPTFARHLLFQKWGVTGPPPDGMSDEAKHLMVI